MALIDRLNLILDGEPLDGVGDNPDVLNRAIKQLVSILESGDQDSILVQNTVIDVDATDFEPSVASGDIVYLDSDEKFKKATVSTAKYIMGVADKANDKIITRGIVEYPSASFTPGVLIYLDQGNAGKLVQMNDLAQSNYPVAISISATEIYYFGGLIKEDIDENNIGDVFLDEEQTLTNKTLTDKSNKIAASYTQLEVVNRTGSTLVAGTVVSLDGWDDVFEKTSVIRSSSSLADNPAVGLVISNISPNQTGLIMTQGLLGSIDLSAYTENELLYVGTTAGTLTNVKPTQNPQAVGRVVENTATGSLFITLASGLDSDIDFDTYTTDAPILTGVSSANENTTVIITRSNNDSEATYFTTVTGGTFVDNGDGTISWTLPDVETDTVYYISEYATRKGELKSDLTTKAITVLSVPVPNPILSGVSSANENSTINITIDNYDAGAISYNISVTAGSFTRTDDVIAWILPEVVADVNHIISVSVTTGDGTSGTTDKVVNVLDVPIEGDAAASITTFGDNEFNDGWSI